MQRSRMSGAHRNVLLLTQMNPCSVVAVASLQCDTPCSMGSWGNDTTCGVYCEHLHVSRDAARGQGAQCHARPPNHHPGR
eukprot:12382016-Alexandrium_andersonii.AAC.1